MSLFLKATEIWPRDCVVRITCKTNLKNSFGYISLTIRVRSNTLHITKFVKIFFSEVYESIQDVPLKKMKLMTISGTTKHI